VSPPCSEWPGTFSLYSLFSIAYTLALPLEGSSPRPRRVRLKSRTHAVDVRPAENRAAAGKLEAVPKAR